MTVKAYSLRETFDRIFGSFTHEDMVSDGTYPIPFACAVIQSLPPRDDEFEYIRDMGSPDIERIFKKERLDLDNDGTLFFIFPERWMSVQEQWGFVLEICRHPQAKNIKGVCIATSSPLIVGNFRKEQVRIITFPDKPAYKPDTPIKW